MFYKETNFQKTSIGNIPKDWAVVNLGDLNHFEIIMGQSPPSITYNKSNDGLPFLQGNAEFGDTYPAPTIFCSKPAKIAKKGDVLISVRAPVGEINIAKEDYCIGRGIGAIRTKQSVSNRFLFYCLTFSKRKLENVSAGSTFKAVRRYEIDNFQIPFPSHPEQHKIVEVLSSIDDALSETREIIAKTERLKQGLMQELLTKGIGHKEFKETEIGKIPKEWELARLSDVGEIVTGTTPPTKVEEYWGEGYPFVTPTDFSETKYVYNPERTVTDKGAKRGRIVFKDSVMVTCIASVGEVSMASEECITNQQINTIICNKKYNPHYVYYSLVFSKGRLRRWAGITTSPIIKKSLFEKFPIGCPSLDEQQKIAEILSDADEKLETERAEKARLERIKQGLIDLLLTGKIRVKM